MKENKRKCYKCGRSPAADPAVKLFRFPRPGTTNTFRAESWAKYCFPDEVCDTQLQIKMYAEHRMLCDRHFHPSSFNDFTNKILDRSAVPQDVKRVTVYIPSGQEQIAGPSRPALMEVTNAVAAPMVSAELVPTAKPAAPVAQAGPTAPVPIAQPEAPAVTAVTVCVPSVHEQSAGPSRSALMKVTNAEVVTVLPAAHVPTAKPAPPVAAAIAQPESPAVTAAPMPPLSRKVTYLYNKCRKNMKKVCQLRNRIKNLKNKIILKSLESDEAVNVLMSKLTPTLALLLQGEIRNLKRNPKGRRWTKEQKITSLRLYKRSPTCYHLLRRLVCLPAPSTLKTLLRKFPLQVGYNENVFNVLKKFAITQQPSDNEYVLAFDEMSIRKNLHYNNKDDLIEGFQDHGNQGRSPQVASHALVFMICGVRKKLKQPVAFYLSGSSVTADRLSVLIKEVLYYCFNSQINVTATVCDMDGVNRRALGILGANSQNPCIEVHNKIITTMFDPPHLLKCFRNLFMKYDIKHLSNISVDHDKTTAIAKWSHIQTFYDLDSTNPNFVFAPTLRQEHLTPNAKQKMRVKLAAQVLSHSVAAGMYCKISQGELTAEATVTANLIASIDKLFDCLNSDTPDLRRGKPCATNLKEKTPHLRIFKDMKKLFNSMEFIGCRSKPPSIEGWVWTLNAIEIYWKKLTTRHPSIRSLATRRLQQDPLENLFGCIRGHCGSNTNPTAGQFIAGLKTALLSRMANTGVRGANCEIDSNDAILNNLKTLIGDSKESSQDATPFALPDLHQQINITFEESMKEVSGEIQACAYVCGFITKKYKNDCTSCKKSLMSSNVELEHNFVNFKEYSEFKSSLKYSSKEMISAVEYCATAINHILEKSSHERNLKEFTLKYLENVNQYFNFLTCVEHKEEAITFIKNCTFYICIRRFCTLKNRKFAEEASANALRKKIKILKHT